MSVRKFICSIIVVAMVSPCLVLAQDAGGNGGGGGGQRGQGGGRGNWDPAQMRERMMTGIKEQLAASDDDWKVIGPKVEKLFDAQRDARAGGMWGGGRGGRGGPGGGGQGNNDQPTTELGKAAADLRSALQDKDASADAIAKKLEAYRDARKKAEEALAEARKEVRELVTQRQEAVLVMAGLLD